MKNMAIIIEHELPLLLFTLTHRYDAVRGHKKFYSPRKIRKTIKKSKYRVENHDAFHSIGHETKRRTRY